MNHLLVFSSEHQCLGEFFFSDGVLDRSMLTPRGERVLGAQIARWQTEGILVSELRDRALADGSIVTIVAQEHVSTRSPEAEAALRAWALHEHLETIDVPPRLLPFWEALSELDLDDEERYGSMLNIRHASHRHVIAWQKAIAQVRQSSEEARIAMV